MAEQVLTILEADTGRAQATPPGGSRFRMVTIGARPGPRSTETRPARSSQMSARYLAFRSMPKRWLAMLLKGTEDERVTPAENQSANPV